MVNFGKTLLRRVKRAVENPQAAKEFLQYRYRRAALRINGKAHDWVRFEPTTEVLNEDWDNLIILDGCRYDVFDEHPFWRHLVSDLCRQFQRQLSPS